METVGATTVVACGANAAVLAAAAAGLGFRSFCVGQPANSAGLVCVSAAQAIEAYSLGGQKKYEKIVPVDGKICSTVVPGWFVKHEWLWQRPRPNVLDVLGELGIK